jgi:hypothetical protein
MGVLDGKTYEDGRGWMYRVMRGLGENNYKARYCKPDKAGWHCVKTLPWRTTREEAQRDLDELAEKKGWSEK